MKKTISLLVLVFISNVFAQHTVTVKKDNMQFTIQGDTTKYSFKATIANYEDRFEDAAKYTIKGIEEGEFKKPENAYYDAACYLTLTNKTDDAVKYLTKSINSGWEDLAHIIYDDDLKPLKNTNEWKTNIEPLIDSYFESNNKELAHMFAQDQKPRINGQIDENLAKEDEARRKQVLEMLENDLIKSGHDFYKAAMIMHHGNTIEDYKHAEIFIQKALATDQIHHMAPWLSAAIKDRLLLKLGKPQWYGTQNMTVVNGKVAMDPKIIDTTAVTPKQRKALNTPSIETLREYLKNFSSN